MSYSLSEFHIRHHALLCHFFIYVGQRWLFIWWSVLLMACPSGSLPPHSSVIWSRATSKPSSHRSEWSCLPHAQNSPRHSSNSSCRTHQQVSARTYACAFVSLRFQQMLSPWWFCLCRSGPNHLGAGQGRQPRSWEVSWWRMVVKDVGHENTSCAVTTFCN